MTVLCNFISSVWKCLCFVCSNVALLCNWVGFWKCVIGERRGSDTEASRCYQVRSFIGFNFVHSYAHGLEIGMQVCYNTVPIAYLKVIKTSRIWIWLIEELGQLVTLEQHSMYLMWRILQLFINCRSQGAQRHHGNALELGKRDNNVQILQIMYSFLAFYVYCLCVLCVCFMGLVPESK